MGIKPWVLTVVAGDFFSFAALRGKDESGKTREAHEALPKEVIPHPKSTRLAKGVEVRFVELNGRLIHSLTLHHCVQYCLLKAFCVGKA
jgi:hypothetical protein